MQNASTILNKTTNEVSITLKFPVESMEQYSFILKEIAKLSKFPSYLKDKIRTEENIPLETMILSKSKWKKVLDRLIEKDIVSFNKSTKEYTWNGIKANHMASLAALATTLQKNHIIKIFPDNTQAARSYFAFFSPRTKSVREWGNHFNYSLPEKYSIVFDFVRHLKD